MLSQLTLFSQGLLGCRGQRWGGGGAGRRGGEHQISSFLDVTTLIIDPVKEHLCSFGVFLASDRLIFSNESDRCQLASEWKQRNLKSCGKLSRSDIFRRAEVWNVYLWIPAQGVKKQVRAKRLTLKLIYRTIYDMRAHILKFWSGSHILGWNWWRRSLFLS